MKNNIFTEFDYIVVKNPTSNDSVSVKVFIHKKNKVFIKTLSIRKVENGDDNYYISEAKKIVEAEIGDGTLKHFVNHRSMIEKVKFMSIGAITVMAIAGITIGIYFGVKNSSGDATELLTFEGTNCVLKSGNDEITQKRFKKGSTVSFKIESTNTSCDIPSKKEVSLSYSHPDGEQVDYFYDEMTGEISLTITKDVTIHAVSSTKWYLDDEYLRGLDATDVEIGVTKTLVVDNHRYRVNLIDVDKDHDMQGRLLHTTWEFADLISDSAGYSLAVQWRDSGDPNYFKSRIHNALVGSEDVLWAQFKDYGWSTTYSKSVLTMLPDDFVNELKVADKGDGTTSIDKLFLLDDVEISGGYRYYSNKSDASRIKKQINGTEKYANAIFIPPYERQQTKSTIKSYAGYNYRDDMTAGGIYWLRNSSYYVHYNGRMLNLSEAGPDEMAFSVVPAFCI